MDTTTGLIFRAGREVAAFDEAALRTAEQAKSRAKKRGQGRLQHQASMLVMAIRASHQTTAALEMVKDELEEMIQEVEALFRQQGSSLEMSHLHQRLEKLLECLRDGRVEMPKPEPASLWARVRGFFSGRK